MAILILILMVFVMFYSLINLKKSIIFILPLFYMVICIYTQIGIEYFNYAKNVPFGFHEKLADFSGIYYPYIFSSVSFIIGIKLATNNDLKNLKRNAISLKISKKTNIYIFLLYITVVVLLHLGHGIGHIYYRTGYTLNGSGIHSLRVMYTLLLPFLCLLLPFLKSPNIRILLVIIMFILIQGTSSRNLILIPACYFIGTQIRDQKFSIPKVCITLLSIIFSIALVMESRNQIIQGVIPNIKYLMTNGVELTFIVVAINYLSSYSVFATAITLQEHSFNLASFLVSINPLPSGFVNIEYMVATQKLNQNSPIPAIGLLALSGYYIMLLYYFIAGFIWQFLYDFVNDKSKLWSIFLVMLFILFTILSTQYNLRGVTRLIYYMIGICIFIKVNRIIKFNLWLISNENKSAPRPLCKEFL